MEPIRILHWFDFTCPFCYVGQQRCDILESRGLKVVHLPFQLHPEIPPEGMEAGPRVSDVHVALRNEAAAAGLPLTWPRRLPSTRTALAAAEWVRLNRPDLSCLFTRRLFAARYVLGEDLGEQSVIERHAIEAGVDVAELRAALASAAAYTSVAEAEALGARYGVRATPSWLIAGDLVSGLLPQSEFERLAEKISARTVRDAAG
ncbi:DsbA family oxidoreductase [Nonomuraea maritima]|uniref:DsbA family oxidoreductase n=1 Tax=Nonomuraea maritima TaxID=683260 RepID=UPI00371A40C5